MQCSAVLAPGSGYAIDCRLWTCIVKPLWSLYGSPRDTCMGDMLPGTFFSLPPHPTPFSHPLCDFPAFVMLAKEGSCESLFSQLPQSPPLFPSLFQPPSLLLLWRVLNGLTEGCPGRWQSPSTRREKLPGVLDG